MNKLNKFITFEGGEGTGKSTVINLLKKKFDTLSIDSLVTREPGGNDLMFSEEIRKIIMNNPDIDVLTEFLLFSASRKEHMDKLIIPTLNKGSFVFCDRFDDSSIVYQGYVKKLSIDVIKKTNNLIIGEHTPEMTFIMDLDPIVALERISSSNRETNRFDKEDIDFHQGIRKAFLSLAELNTQRYIVIDASKGSNEIAEEIMGHINKRFKL